MKYFDEQENRYCEKFSTPPPQYLTAIERDTNLNVYLGKMTIGQLPGRFISILSQFIQPQRILEIGTFTGYSALCLAEGLPKEGSIDCIEKNKELEKKIIDNFSHSPHRKKMNLLIGEALDILPKKMENGEQYDLVFIDANKKEYPQYLKYTSQLLKKDGWLIADNTLWSGKVYNSNNQDANYETKQLKKFNKMLSKDTSYNSLLMPFYDGLTIAKRVK